MQHLGDISKINGASIAPVDIITFGSPCQDLSVAGKQAGLDGERSGLFMEAVRIIKEMRDATNGKQPRFAVWENVPGAFSSNKGADFQTVLLELCKITEPKAPAVAVPKAGWPPAGQLTDVGGGSIAYRTIDAQFHGVPQRRRRIILVCDFAGQRAGDLLFKPGGLPGYPAPGVCEGQASPGAVAVGTDSSVIGFAYRASPSAGSVSAAVDLAPTLLAERNDAAICLNDQGGQVMDVSNDITGTLRAQMKGNAPIVLQDKNSVVGFDMYNQASTGDVVRTLKTPLGGDDLPVVCVLQGSMIGGSDDNGPNGAGLAEDTCFTLTATDRHAVVIENHANDSRVNIREDNTVQTLTGRMGTGGVTCH